MSTVIVVLVNINGRHGALDTIYLKLIPLTLSVIIVYLSPVVGVFVNIKVRQGALLTNCGIENRLFRPVQN